MDQVQLDFTLKYLKENPSAYREEINAAYLQSQQGSVSLSDPGRIQRLREQFGYTPRLGGIGGTTYREEAFANFEGVDVNSNFTCKRLASVTKLHSHLQNKFEDYMGGLSWDTFVCECDKVQTILIMDEIQVLYNPEGASTCLFGGDRFWDTVKRVPQGGGLHPHHEINTWNFKDVRYAEQEYADFFDVFCRSNLKLLPEGDVPRLADYVKQATKCHPGLVSFALNDIVLRFRQQLNQGAVPLTFEKIFKFFQTDDFYQGVKERLGFRTRVHTLTNSLEDFIKKGWVDFYVDNEHDWMIELVRDGEDLEKHREKMKDVLYGSILKCAKHHAINFSGVEICINDIWDKVQLCKSRDLYTELDILVTP
ncbi:3053_t:CDS:2 [Ambispora leptoticha]|uniref:3053_t:CDS:1 n=1 Tax=Ambispora leptoticha TaxID=144679 RepID=A0A9N9CFN6_9GLOM|nr:3053_t:CDS:2 [Ambispora leptoticha]